ncbi:hypothetical protein NZK32_08635 [Cyanobium sp. FGCU-52]|nr:hypothetical protein [Cyanobium sp. FGCU52]
MESRRLVVWISAGILGFQGGTLALDLINCTVLSWLWVERHGLEQVARPQGGRGTGLRPLAGEPSEEAALVPFEEKGQKEEGEQRPSPGPPPSAAKQDAGASPVDPMGVFCQRPHDRIDAAVSQGLTILAGLALGGSVGAGGRTGSDP